jgi:hypothetical protein
MTGAPAIVWLLVGMMVVATVVAVTYMVATRPEPIDYDAIYPAGDCVIFDGPGIHEDQFAEQSIEGGDCDGSHTHVIVAVTTDPALCPPETDAAFEIPFARSPVRCLAAAK